MKEAEFKNKDKKELEKLMEEKKERMRELRFDLASGKVKNISEIRTIRKDIARISTMINSIK